MTVTPSSTIIGIFRDRSMAEQAIEALYNAGFEHEQTSFLAPGTSGGFVENLKNLFTGTNPNQDNLSDNLTNMGLSDDETDYYSNEYNKGNTILAVKAPGREQEALNIMYQYGAYNSKIEMNSFKETTYDAPQPSGSSQQDRSAVWGEQYNAQSWETQQQSHTAEEYPSEVPQQYNATSDDNGMDDKTQPVTSSYDPEPQNPHANEVASEQDIDYWETQANADTIARDTDYQTSLITPEHNTGYQASQTNVVTPEHEVGSQTTTSDNTTSDAIRDDAEPQNMQTIPVTQEQISETPTTRADSVSTEHVDEMQQIREHIQALQQQLQEAKSQLQAAREQEAQLKLAREREQELQAARQQLQEVQTELQAILAELQETQSRIKQYQ